MLRGRGSSAISERPTPSPSLRLLATSHQPLATSLVTPLFPVHPRNVLVSPIIPVHTQKQGGGGIKTFAFHSPLPQPLPLVSNTGDSNRLVQGRTASEGVPYTNCKRVPQKPPFHRELIKYVGAPTFLIVHANKKKQNPPASERSLYKNSAPLFSFFSALLLAISHLFTQSDLCEGSLATKSNYSRTYSPFSRKSNYSRTYAKQGGGGASRGADRAEA
jgi:hypothetical protein